MRFAVVGSQLAHMWRVGADVKDWDGVYEVPVLSTVSALERDRWCDDR